MSCIEFIQMGLSNTDAPLISVIVPIYHSEAYLGRCLKSIFEQTYCALEILLILDGYSSKAEKIISQVLDNYPCRKNQIRLIRHGENKGICYCRQEGHELSTGEYIYHCDSDDWLELDAFEVLCCKAREQQADLVYFDYVRHYEHGGRDAVYSSSRVSNGIVDMVDGTLQNKLIRRQFIVCHSIRFPDGINWGEDLFMSILLHVMAVKVSYCPQVFYHYNIHKGSVTTEVTLEKYEQLVACPSLLEKELRRREKLDVYTMLIMRLKFESKVYYLIHPKIRDLSRWLSVYPECHPYISHFSEIPFYLKCVSWMTIHRMQPAVLFCLFLRDLYHKIRN